mgnify:CR=1 FL=1
MDDVVLPVFLLRRLGVETLIVTNAAGGLNRDYHVTFTPEEMEQKRVYYNYTTGTFPAPEGPGISVFYRDDDGTIYHTYSTYARGLDMLNGAYHLLDLVSYFTVGEDEVRAWTIRRGDRAPRAAGRIHSDLEKGFIRAEVVHYDDFVALGSESRARQEGKLRLEGKEYVVKDGDILTIRHSG